MKFVLLSLALVSCALAMPIAENEKTADVPQISVDYSSVAKNEEKPVTAEVSSEAPLTEDKPAVLLSEPAPSEKRKESAESSEEASGENKSDESNESSNKPDPEKPVKLAEEVVQEADKKLDVLETAKNPAALADESLPAGSHVPVPELSKEATPVVNEDKLKEEAPVALAKEDETRSEEVVKKEETPLVEAEKLVEPVVDAKNPVESLTKTIVEDKPLDVAPIPISSASIVAPAAVAEEKQPEIKAIDSEKSEIVKTADASPTTAAPAAEENKEQLPALVAEKEIPLAENKDVPKTEENVSVSPDNTDRVVREAEDDKKEEAVVAHEEKEDPKLAEEKPLEPVALPAAQELPKEKTEEILLTTEKAAEEKEAKSEEKLEPVLSEEKKEAESKSVEPQPTAEVKEVVAENVVKPVEPVAAVETLPEITSDVKIVEKQEVESEVKTEEKPVAEEAVKLTEELPK